MKKKIAIDIDDVLADTTEAIRVVVNNHLGIDLQPDNYKSVNAEYWDYYEEVWRTHGFSEDFSFEHIEDKLLNKDENIPMMAGAEFALKELSKKYDVVLITSRDKRHKEVTENWIATNMSGVKLDVHFAYNIKVVDQKRTKGEIAKELGADILIDDNPGHCKSAIEHGLDTILFGNYGWQNNVDKTIKRCADWPEVLDYLT